MGRSSRLWILQHFLRITLYYHLLQEVSHVQVMIWFLKITFYYHLHVIILFHSLEETLMSWCIPESFPPNVNLCVVSLDLDKENAFLMLQLMRYLKNKNVQTIQFLIFLNIEQYIF